ncbi:MAG TPA: helix-turn-helix transcriptional regulator [Streptosporangiaceae bacterium]|nr:helix-turn-helix transcriptional regulator [Streptosporangiaceae bacterium]
MPAVLACPACRTGLLARRGDPLCPTCVKAARDIAPGPSWLFDSPLLRQALAEVNLAAVPAIVRAACGLSQRDLAAIVGWSGAALSYYERGRRDGMFDIRTVLRFADAVGMPRAALLPLVFADPEAGLTTVAGEEAGAGPGWIGPGSPDATAMAGVLPLVGGPGGVNSSHIRYWQACAETLYARDRTTGATGLLPSALEQWRRVRLALKETGHGEISGQLLGAAGEMALCAGLIALDAGRLTLARSLYAEARELAANAGDGLLTVHALTSQSMLYAEMAGTGPGGGPARQALRLAFQAQEEGRYLAVPRLHALIAVRHAIAASLLGDKAAFRAAITQARRQLEQGPGNDHPPGWLRSVGETEITAAEARGYLNLGEPGRGVLLYRQVLAARLSAPSRASCGAWLACALLQQGARGDAVAAAMDVLPALEAGVASTRCLDQLRPVRQAAVNTMGATEFCERFDAIELTLAVPHDLPGDDAPGARDDIPALSQGTGRPGSTATAPALPVTTARCDHPAVC